MYYEEIFQALNKRKVKYVVVGGVAVVLHGIVRLTVDLDLMIDLDKKNTERFLEAAGSLGYVPKAPVAPAEFADPAKRELWKKEKNMIVFSLCNPKKPFEELDVFIYNPIDFSAAYKNRKVYKVAGLSIPVVSLEDLKKLKKLSGRKQDEADITALLALEELMHEKKTRR
jgi:predicted nucleotidyltransferase